MKSLAITPHQFALYRIVLALYCLVHFLGLLPYGTELFSDQGMLSDPSVLPTWGILPTVFTFGDSPTAVMVILGCAILLSVLLALGVQRRIIALLLWWIWASLFNRNILISNPSIPFIGLLLLICAALPRGEPLARAKTRANWAFPQWVYWGLLLALMGGYTASGLHKLGAASWVDGTALRHILELPLARDNLLRPLVLSLPESVFACMTWGALGMEILALPLALWRVTRPYIWLGPLSMNLGILMLVNFADLTFGILVMHLFTFDGRWLKPTGDQQTTPIVYFDGMCNLCNGAVDFIIAEDTTSRFKFAPTESAAADALDSPAVSSGQSMALKVGDTLYTESDAVMQVGARLGGLWRALSWLRWVPRPLRNFGYTLLQKNRYRIFGKRETCRLPTSEERARFME
jgi:predicted DCC family thiol-disulfide oxidoreductase YuxK